MKRKTALEIIRIEFAENGRPTQTAFRAMLKGKVSIKAYQAKAHLGMEIFRKRNVVLPPLIIKNEG